MDSWDSIGLPPSEPPPPSQPLGPLDPWNEIGVLPSPTEIPSPVQPETQVGAPQDGSAWEQIGLPSQPEAQPEATPAEMPSVGQSLMLGLERAATSGEQTAAALQGKPALTKMTPEEEKLSAPMSWGDLGDAALFGLKILGNPGAAATQTAPAVVPKFVYGTAETAPTLAAGTGGAILGGSIGGAIGGPPGAFLGGTAGASLAAAAMNGVQELGPSYAQELQKTPLDPDSAFDRAFHEATKSGAITGLTWAAFGINPFKDAVKNLLFQSAIVQPSIAVAQKVGQNQAQGKPWYQDALTGVPGAVATTLIPMVGFHGVELLGKNKAGLDVEPIKTDESVLTDTARTYLAKENEQALQTQDFLATQPKPSEEVPAAAPEREALVKLNDELTTLFSQKAPETTRKDYVVDNALMEKGPITVSLVRHPGGAYIETPSGHHIDVGEMLKAGASPEEAISRRLSDNADPYKPDLSKVRPVEEAPAEKKTLGGKAPEELPTFLSSDGKNVDMEGLPKKGSRTLNIDGRVALLDMWVRQTREKYKDSPQIIREVEGTYARERNKLVLEQADLVQKNRPQNIALHKAAIKIGKAFLDMRKQMKLPGELTFRFLKSIPDNPRWLASASPIHEAPFGTPPGLYRIAPFKRGIIEVAVDDHSLWGVTPSDHVRNLFASIAHEFGHHLVSTKYASAPDYVKRAIARTFRDWRRSSGPNTSINAALLKRDNFIATHMGLHRFSQKVDIYGNIRPTYVRDLSFADRKYWLSLEEFIAENVARWATTHEKPRLVADKWFKGIGQMLLRAWDSATLRFFGKGQHQEFAPIPELGNWLDSLMTAEPYAQRAFQEMELRSQGENQAALKRAGEDPTLAVPQQAEIQAPRNAMKALYKGNQVPPRVEAAAAHADRFGGDYKWMLSLQQIAKRNLEIAGLQRYREYDALKKLDRDKIMAEAHATLREWKRLSVSEAQNLTHFIDDLVQMAYRTPEEAMAKVRRWPTVDEFKKLAQDWGVSQRGLNLFKRISNDFDRHLERIRQLMLKDTDAIQNPIHKQQAIQDINRQIEEMRKSPYFPAMRFGHYWVRVNDEAGRQIEFRTFGTAKEARAYRAKAAAQEGQFAEVGVLPEQAAPFMGMPPGLLDKIVKKLSDVEGKPGLSSEQLVAINQLRYELAPAQSFRHRLQKRKLVPGYSTDFRRAYANYFFHGANYYSKTKYRDNLLQQIKDVRESYPSVQGYDKIKRQDIANYMQEHYQEMMQGKSDYAALRALTFHYHLGVLPAKALLNLSQVPLVTYPFLASKFGDVRAVREITKAGTDLSTFYKKGTLEAATEGELRAMGELVREGIITEAMAPELAAVSEGRNLSQGVVGNNWQKFMQWAGERSGYLFGMSEQVNRRVTARAAYRLAKEKPDATYVREQVKANKLHFDRLRSEGFSEHEAAAIVTAADAVRSTQFEYHREALPKLFWGKRRTLFAFQTFKQNMLFYFLNNPTAAARTFLIYGFLGGLMGVPGMEDLNGILKGIGWRLFGKDWDLEKNVREYVSQMFGDDAAFKGVGPSLGFGKGRGDAGFADLILHGTGRYGFGIPAAMNMLGGTVGLEIPFPSVDRSQSVGMGKILPVDMNDIIGIPTTDKSRAIKSLVNGSLGATFSIPVNMWDAVTDFSNDGRMDPKLLEKGLPAWMRALGRAGRYYNEGIERARDGSAVVRFDPNDTEHMMEILSVALGYTPTRVSQTWDRVMANSEVDTFWKLDKESLYRQLDTAVRGGDQEAIDRVLEAAKAHNERAPKVKEYIITKDSLKASLRNRARSRMEHESGASTLPDIRRMYPEATGIIDVQKVQ